MSLPAGLVRMLRLKFAVLTTIGSLTWNMTLIAGAGHSGRSTGASPAASGPVSTAITVALVFMAAGIVMWRTP